MSSTQQDQASDIKTNGVIDYRSVRDAVLSWPLSMCVTLIHEVLNTLTREPEQQDRKLLPYLRSMGCLRLTSLHLLMKKSNNGWMSAGWRSTGSARVT